MKNKAKRIIVLFIMLILSIVLVGCNNKENSMKIICDNGYSEKQMREHIDNDLKKNNMFKNNNKENSMKIICDNGYSEKQMREHIDNDLKKNNMFKNNNLFENIDK